MERLGIVADDLTGAMDTAVQFAKWGLHSVVMLCDDPLPPADMVVVSTDSRNESTGEAYRRAKDAARRMAGRRVYKKIDSTMRGNVGAEIEGILDGLGLGRALVAPAFPSTGRTTVDGYHRVNGILLSESSFARDPVWPATESHLPTLLGKQTTRSVGHLPLSTVEEGVEAVVPALESNPSPVVVADARESSHLQTLSLALGRMGNGWLPVGCAGLAEEWPVGLGLSRMGEGSFSWEPIDSPVLVVAGSRNPSTARQLERAAEDGRLKMVKLDAADGWETALETEALPSLKAGRHVAITTCFSAYQEGLGQATADGLARAAGWLAGRVRLAGLFMTGGDIARSACRRLGAGSVRVLGEVQPGVPAGLLQGGEFDGTRVVTKAGGFGDELAIVRSIDCLRGKLS